MPEKKIYILITDTGTLFTKLIKLYTKSPLNHASIAFDKKLEEIYSFGRKKPHNPFNGGFVQENISNHLFKRADCAVYSCLVSEVEYQELNNSIQRIKANQESYKYNLLGLIGVLLGKEMSRKNAYFCSQFVATLLHMNGIIITNKSPNLTTPEDIRQSHNITLEYEGKLSSYPFSAKKANSFKLEEKSMNFSKRKKHKIRSYPALAFHKIRHLISS